jgi:phosphatidylserine/phosphatidylglycerophosphate/cardiolipin synthase-like enzyme
MIPEEVTFSPPRFQANDAAALFDSAAYAEMLAILGRAEHSIRLTFYLFGGPDADKMIDVLAERQAAGVSIHVLLDCQVGSSVLDPVVGWECRRSLRKMRRLGIDVLLSDPRTIPDWPGRETVSHHKYIVVDDREAMIGGMNLATLFWRYHDLMIYLKGPAAESLSRQFDLDWATAEDRKRGRAATQLAQLDNVLPSRSDRSQTFARIVGTGVGRRTTEGALLNNLKQSETSVSVAVCEMGTSDLTDELIACHKRGVSVRVLLCPLKLSPLLPIGTLNARAVEMLKQAGVPVYYYKLGKDFIRLHMKMAIFDGSRAIAGSTNWTRGGLRWIGETDVELIGGKVIEELKSEFESDWLRAAPAPHPSPLAMWMHNKYERLSQ